MKHKSKKIIRNVIFFFLWIISLTILSGNEVKAANTITPHILTSGSDADQSKAKMDTFKLTSNDVVPLNIKKNGCLVMNIRTNKSAMVNIAVHKKADCSDLPFYLGAQCTDYTGNKDVVINYFTKGTYYLKFTENEYNITCWLYSNETQTLKNDTAIAAYCDYKHPAMATYKATKNGYITIAQKKLYGMDCENSVTLCDSKGNAITDAVADHKMDEPVVFPVKKGKTYKIKIVNIEVDRKQFYQCQVKFTSRDKKYGNSKSKAQTIKLKNEALGLLYAEDKTSAVHWYKFSNTQNQKLTLTVTGHVSSGSVKVTFYDKSGKKMGVYDHLSSVGNVEVYDLVTVKNKSVIPKGTYYIKVQKTKKRTAATYSVLIKAKKK